MTVAAAAAAAVVAAAAVAVAAVAAPQRQRDPPSITPSFGGVDVHGTTPRGCPTQRAAYAGQPQAVVLGFGVRLDTVPQRLDGSSRVFRRR